MIKLIVAIDAKNGLANDSGIPWQGKIPGDVEYFRKMIFGHTILLGYGTYLELNKPFSGSRNLVASSKLPNLKPGFELVSNVEEFIHNSTDDIWIIGGAKLFSETIYLAQELYLTRLDGDFNCNKFFPTFDDHFGLISSSKKHVENNISYNFEVWRRRD